jgi:hypothetical protein
VRSVRIVWAVAALFALGVAACRSERRLPDMRFWTDQFEYRVSFDSLPPRASEPVIYTVVVRDKETKQPVEGGEGRIFATSKDGASTWDSFVPGHQLGTYTAKLRFITAGEWAIAIQFRRDSTQALERLDWRQEVRAAQGPGT